MITSRRRFSPSTNLIRDVEGDIAYHPTANAQRVYFQILNDFAVGIHSFSLIGSYGTGKSSFLVALEQTLNRTASHFAEPNGHFGGAQRFHFINIVGAYASLAHVLAEKLGASSEQEVWSKLDTWSETLRQENGFLMIAVDEFGKFLEYAAQESPERDLYFIQQLAEYVNGSDKNIALIVTLHQNFSAYAYGLQPKQREEWEKVKGRLKELTFNEPVEQLLELAAKQMEDAAAAHSVDGLSLLVEVIDDSRAFPHRRKLQEAFARQLLPFDLLAASVLTQALQKYGQNERSLFTFLNSNDPHGINDYDRTENRYYNLACVYDYLAFNYESLLSSVHNPHFAQWGAIRGAIERVEADVTERIKDALVVVKLIGLLNIFAPQGARIDGSFLCNYAELTLGMRDVDKLLQELEARKLIRFVRFKETFVLFDGTDLNIESALLEAGSKIEQITDVTILLRRYFTFPMVLAKSVSYKTGTPRFFGYYLSAEPLMSVPEDSTVDGVINLIFAENLDLDLLREDLQGQDARILTCWYHSARQVREILHDIAKTNYVIANNESDKVAVRELQNLRAFQIDMLNQQVLHSIYAEDGSVEWLWRGQPLSISGPDALNSTLSGICLSVFTDTPVLRNELVNRTNISSAIATARKAYFRALVDEWNQPYLGFDADTYPPEKTIYLTLLKNSGTHRFVDEQWTLDAPIDPSFRPLWDYCEQFLVQSRVAPKNVADLFDALRRPPFGLKQGLIDFWVPTFLFAHRETFALYREERFQPDITAESLDLLRLNPQKYQVKSFSVDGIKLRFFNRCRTLIQGKETERITQSGFLETIKPFIVFYSSLPPYAKHTRRLSTPAQRLRTAIANAKDPEKTFFEDFPSALGFPHVADEQASEDELEAYIQQLQSSVRELQSCFDDLIDRVEEFLLDTLGLKGERFPDYKPAIVNRFASLRTYLLLPRQRTLHVRLTSPLEDRTAWLGAVVHGVLGRDVKQLTDEDERVLYARIGEAIQELDNLCELDTIVTDPEKEASAMRVEITVLGQESRTLLQRLPKQKEEAASALQSRLRAVLTDDVAVNRAALIRLLQEIATNE